MSTSDAVTLFDVGGGQVWVPYYAKTKAKIPVNLQELTTTGTRKSRLSRGFLYSDPSEKLPRRDAR